MRGLVALLYPGNRALAKAFVRTGAAESTA